MPPLPSPECPRARLPSPVLVEREKATMDVVACHRIARVGVTTSLVGVATFIIGSLQRLRVALIVVSVVAQRTALRTAVDLADSARLHVQFLCIVQHWAKASMPLSPT